MIFVPDHILTWGDRQYFSKSVKTKESQDECLSQRNLCYAFVSVIYPGTVYDIFIIM